jgi:putative ABC transport system substrate-binding protein
MNRREFITLLGGAVAWPLAAHAQQRALPVVGWLQTQPAARQTIDAFRRGLAETGFLQALRENGFVEGRTVEFDFRWGSYDDLPALAAELVRRRVAVIWAGGPPAVRAAMAATTTIPIVFGIGEDPVKEGLVTSLSRPSGNVTGYTNFSNQLVAKRLDLLRELVPSATTFGFLANQTNPNIDPDTAEVKAAADARGLRLRLLTASTDRELEMAFDAMAQQRIDALVVGVDPWFRSRRDQVVALAARHAVPASYERRDFAEAGGLMSYGTDENERERQMGLYVARILKGAKPADLPVQQAPSTLAYYPQSTTKIRSRARWRDGMAARGARAAAGPRAAYRGARPATRHHRDRHNPADRCRPAGDADDPDRLCGRGRSRRRSCPLSPDRDGILCSACSESCDDEFAPPDAEHGLPPRADRGPSAPPALDRRIAPRRGVANSLL